MAEAIRLKNLPDLKVLKKISDRYPKADIDPESLEVLFLMNRIAGDIHNFFRKDFDDFGLTSARFTLLMRLRREPEVPLNPSVLSDYLGVTRATISGLLEGLEKAGNIKRVNCHQDRRCCFVQLTKPGLKLIDKVAPAYFAQISGMLKGLKKSEVKTFKKVLLALNDQITK
jgi:MarR family transcriptional repressor of emrRAB